MSEEDAYCKGYNQGYTKGFTDGIEFQEQKDLDEFLEDLNKNICKCGCGDILHGYDLIEKWEAKKNDKT